MAASSQGAASMGTARDGPGPRRGPVLWAPIRAHAGTRGDPNAMSRPGSPGAPPLVRNAQRVAIGLTLALLLATAAFVYLEHSLPGPRWFQHKQTVFVAGSIGTEFIPLPVLEVLPDIDPE